MARKQGISLAAGEQSGIYWSLDGRRVSVSTGPLIFVGLEVVVSSEPMEMGYSKVAHMEWVKCVVYVMITFSNTDTLKFLKTD